MPTRIEKEPPSRFPTVILWLNDIKDIVKMIETETGSKATLSDGEYKYDSLAAAIEVVEAEVVESISAVQHPPSM